MSTSEDPIENPRPLDLLPEAVTPVERKPPVEDPAWNGSDVALVVGLAIVSFLLLPLGVIGVARLLVFKQSSWQQIARIPEMLMLIQLVMYIAVFGAMYIVVRYRSGRFWESIRWNWPRKGWAGFLAAGAVVYFLLAGLGALLPIPKHLPIERFFETAREATIMSIFAVTLAPLMEELFFRGFLYPVLARRFGVGVGVFVTGAAFGLLHGAQLKYSWAVLIIFLVGVILTLVRARTKSVAASVLVHVGYNGTLTLLMLAATGGFRHLERLSQ